MQLMSRRHAEYENMLEIRQIQCQTSIHAHKMPNLSVIWYFINKMKKNHLQLHIYHRKCHSRQLSRCHADNELKWEITQLLLLSAILAHIQSKVNTLSGPDYLREKNCQFKLHHSATKCFFSPMSRRHAEQECVWETR